MGSKIRRNTVDRSRLFLQKLCLAKYPNLWRFHDHLLCLFNSMHCRPSFNSTTTCRQMLVSYDHSQMALQLFRTGSFVRKRALEPEPLDSLPRKFAGGTTRWILGGRKQRTSSHGHHGRRRWVCRCQQWVHRRPWC